MIFDDLKDLKEIQLVVFRMGKEEYALPIKCVQEIIIPPALTKVPRLPSFIEGIINLRGQIIPIIDGKKKFSIFSEASSALVEKRIIVIDVANHTVGLTVDEVSEVIMLNISDIEPPPRGTEDDCQALWGVGKFKDRLIILLNGEKFLDEAEAVGLMKVQNIPDSQAA